MKQNKIIELGRVEKVLLRPNRYIGSISKKTITQFVYNKKTNKMEFRKVIYVEGLIKIIREVIDNSIDEAVRTNGKFANRIKIDIKNGKFTIEDNGRGIPVELVEGTKRYMPESAWTILDAGTNFEDEEDNTTMGQNGEGVVLTCIFSKEFKGVTCDGKKRFTLTSKPNLSGVTTKIDISKVKKTSVSFLPDYERFGLSGFDSEHEAVLYTDIINLSMSYPNISFILNGTKVGAKNFSEYVSLFGDHSEILTTNGLSIGILPNSDDDFRFMHNINGLNVSKGGVPLNWAVTSVLNPLLVKLKKKFPNIKIGDMKNKSTFIVFFNGMIKPRFEDQVKSICTNNFSEFKGQIEIPNFEKFADKLRRNTDFLDPITEIYKVKEELRKRQELKKLTKPNGKRIKNEKYMPATKLKEYLLLVEGDSASSGLASELGRDNYSYFALKGKPLNVIKATHEAFMKNTELKGLYDIISNDPHRFDIFATDADLDGFAIRNLLFGFYLKYFPEKLKNGRVGVLQTPVVICRDKRGKLKETFYSLREYNVFVDKHGDDYNFKYLKGLGSYEDGELDEVIAKDGMEKLIAIVKWEDHFEEIIMDWLGAGREQRRKELILANEFDIGKI